MAGTVRGRNPPPLLSEAIKTAYKTKERDEPPRTYIGASTIGHSCDAFLALCLRGFPENLIDGKLQRIFKIGHAIEEIVIADLREARIPVYNFDPTTGRQWRFEKYKGNIACNADALAAINGAYVLIEVKSMNNFNFMNFKRQGIEVSHPKYVDQMQMLMGMSGHSTTHIVAYNKDTSDYHSQEVTADPLVFASQMERIERVIFGEPARQSPDPTWTLCQRCLKSDSCWGNNKVPKTCKTCAKSYVEKDGTWMCSLTKAEAEEVCGNWVRYRPKER